MHSNIQGQLQKQAMLDRGRIKDVIRQLDEVKNGSVDDPDEEQVEKLWKELKVLTGVEDPDPLPKTPAEIPPAAEEKLPVISREGDETVEELLADLDGEGLDTLAKERGVDPRKEGESDEVFALRIVNVKPPTQPNSSSGQQQEPEVETVESLVEKNTKEKLLEIAENEEVEASESWNKTQIAEAIVAKRVQNLANGKEEK